MFASADNTDGHAGMHTHTFTRAHTYINTHN